MIAQLYRTKEEIDALKERDALGRFEGQLVVSGVLTEQQAARRLGRRAGRRWTRRSSSHARARYPAPESALDHVFA